MDIKLSIKSKNIFNLYNFFKVLFIILITFSTTEVEAKIYKVENIEVIEPYDIYFKKEEVIEKAFSDAFDRLILKIVSSKDYKNVSSEDSKIIRSLVDSFEIIEEKFINKNYSAKFNVMFERKGIINFLHKQNIKSSIPKEEKIFFVPILINLENNELFLYNDNIFFSNWNINQLDRYLLNYLIPEEDLEDFNIIKKNLENIEDYNFEEISLKYLNQNSIYSIFFVDNNNLNILSKVNFENFSKILKKEYKNLNLYKLEEVQKIITDLKISFEDEWKVVNEINLSINLPLTISLPSKEIALIKKFESELLKSDLVYDYQIDKFSNDKNIYKIIFNGTPNKFLSDFKSKNFEIDISKEIWTIQ